MGSVLIGMVVRFQRIVCGRHDLVFRTFINAEINDRLFSAGERSGWQNDTTIVGL